MAREEAIHKLLSSRSVPATLPEIAFVIGLSYPVAAAVLRRLVQEGKVNQVGRDGRRVLFMWNESYGEDEPTPQDELNEPDTGERADVIDLRTAAPAELPSVAINSVLRQIHLGKELEVIGFHLEAGDPQPLIDLRSHDGEVVTVSLVG